MARTKTKKQRRPSPTKRRRRRKKLRQAKLTATIDALEQKAFELANNPMVDHKAIKSVFTLLLQARDQSLKQKDIDLKLRRLQLLEENALAAKEKLNQLARKGAGLSTETLT